ncbi:hypothetical protein D3C79_719550 [compost metagenome]
MRSDSSASATAAVKACSAWVASSVTLCWVSSSCWSVCWQCTLAWAIWLSVSWMLRAISWAVAAISVMAVATCWVWMSCSAMSALASLEAVLRWTARSCRERVASSTRPSTVRILACSSLMWKSAMALGSSPE